MAVEAVADREMFIDGGPVRALGGQWIDALNPATGEILAGVPAGGVDDVDRAVRAGRAAFRDRRWRGGPPSERAGILRKRAGLIEAKGEDSAPTATPRTGAV